MSTIELERRMSAPPEEIFPYFTDPELLRIWQGTSVDLDPRPGGLYLVHFGPAARIRGEYLVVDPPRRLVYSWGWEIAEPSVLAKVPPGSSKIEITFVPDGDGTIIRVQHSGLPDAEDVVRMVTWGWETYLGRLGETLSGSIPGEDPALALIASLDAPS